ncbi:MAG: carbon-nitrogen hydrolase family protein [Turneriella sp.]|nr:carbon-nitrogen hydrolase family protein [Turneriella sp.]
MRVAAVQLSSQADIADNLATAEKLLVAARDAGACYALLPENFAFMGSEEEKQTRGEEIGHMATEFLKRMAKTLGIVITGGGLPLPAGGGKFFNAALSFGPNGSLVHRYDKIHLFDATPGDGVSYRESATTVAGSTEISLLHWDKLCIGVAICYDLRFPQLFQSYALAGANLIVVPAAFTHITGSAHWHVLLRSRAIENTCYVLAAAQCGTHPGGRQTFGKSLWVDPWGEVLATLHDEPGILVGEIDLERLAEIRRRLPCLSHIQKVAVTPNNT